MGFRWLLFGVVAVSVLVLARSSWTSNGEKVKYDFGSYYCDETVEYPLQTIVSAPELDIYDTTITFAVTSPASVKDDAVNVRYPSFRLGYEDPTIAVEEKPEGTVTPSYYGTVGNPDNEKEYGIRVSGDARAVYPDIITLSWTIPWSTGWRTLDIGIRFNMGDSSIQDLVLSGGDLVVPEESGYKRVTATADGFILDVPYRIGSSVTGRLKGRFVTQRSTQTAASTGTMVAKDTVQRAACEKVSADTSVEFWNQETPRVRSNHCYVTVPALASTTLPLTRTEATDGQGTDTSVPKDALPGDAEGKK